MITEKKILDSATTIITEKIIADLIDDEVIELRPHVVRAPALRLAGHDLHILPCVCNIFPPASDFLNNRPALLQANNQRGAMPYVVYEYFLAKFGVRSLADFYLLELIEGLKMFPQSNQRIT